MGNPYRITRTSHGLDTSFMEDALCRKEGLNTRVFFTDLGRSADDRVMVMEAKAVCVRCPVRSECLMYALSGKERGVWGATTTEERDYFTSKGRFPSAEALVRKRPRKRTPKEGL